MGEPVDDFRTPALLRKAMADFAPDRPVQENQFPTDRERRPDPSLADMRLELLEELVVTERCVDLLLHRSRRLARR